ncbi:MAG: protein kinase [Kofleriaceae bacterium]
MSVPGEVTSRSSTLGRYELITRIGQGGMAEVQLALQRGPAGFEKLVVVKLVHESLATQKTFVDMLLEEARLAALVKHPNVVDIYDLGEADGRYFIAMEYLEGEPLLSVLRAGREGKRLDPLSTGRMIADTAEGLDAAHELHTLAGDPIELVHHDISLGNIVVLYNGQIKLVDFGVAKASQSAARSTKIQGKFSYMAPEKLRGGAGDRRSDIWSLGCVLWEALTLRRLFKGGNDQDTMRQVLDTQIQKPSQINHDVPSEFDPIVMRALDREPANRYATAKDLANDLEELLRERKYGGKNDQIAKYMQATFGEHIAARKKLLQEVSSKGRASADVLEAAFKEPAVPRTHSISEFSVRFRRGQSGELIPPDATPRQSDGELAPERAARASQPHPIPPAISAAIPLIGSSTAEATPPGTAAASAAAPPMPVVDATSGATHHDRALRNSDGIPAVTPPADSLRHWVPTPGIDASVLADAAVLAASTSEPVTASPAPTHNRRNALVIGGVLLGIVVIAVTRGGDAPAAATHGPIAKTPPPPSRVFTQAASTPTAPPAVAPEPEPKLTTEPQAVRKDVKRSQPSPAPPPAAAHVATDEPEIEFEPTPVVPASTPAPVVARPRPQPRPNAEALFTAGVQAFVRGDVRAAIANCRRAQQANPSYALPWRCLGMSYEKLGEAGMAKGSFERYLQLAPNASDSWQIREKIQRL